MVVNNSVESVEVAEAGAEFEMGPEVAIDLA